MSGIERDRRASCTEAAPVVKDFFDRQADRYSMFYDPATKTGSAVLFQMRRDFAVAMLAEEAGRAVLDLATGTGELTHAVAARLQSERLHLNDLSPDMLRHCRAMFSDHTKFSEIEWSTEDAFELLDRTNDGRFDVILCLGLIAHTGHLPLLLSNAYSALKSGGVLLLQSSLTDHPGAWLTAAYARSSLRPRSYKVSAYSQRDIRNAVAAGGFEVADVRRFGLCLPFGDRLLGRLNHRLESAFAAKLETRGGEALFKLRKPR